MEVSAESLSAAASVHIALKLNEMPALTRLMQLSALRNEIGLYSHPWIDLRFDFDTAQQAFEALHSRAWSDWVALSLEEVQAELRDRISHLSGAQQRSLLLEWQVGAPLSELAPCHASALEIECAASVLAVAAALLEVSCSVKVNTCASSHSSFVLLLELIFQMYCNPGCSIAMISHLSRMSERHILRLLRQHANESYTRFINKRRIERAKYLLVHSRRRIKEVGTLVGYVDISWFGRRFQEETGLTPTKFRKTYQAGSKMVGARSGFLLKSTPRCHNTARILGVPESIPRGHTDL